MKRAALNQLSRDISPILKEYRVSFAALFGSRAKSANSRHSDYDILIDYYPRSGFSLLDLVGLRQDLKKKLKTKVDVVTKNGLSPYMKKDILNSLQILYDKRKR
ncbi:MAG: nucleotidyltransferase domain-containing protein [Patescibacteria group bacterium]